MFYESSAFDDLLVIFYAVFLGFFILGEGLSLAGSFSAHEGDGEDDAGGEADKETGLADGVESYILEVFDGDESEHQVFDVADAGLFERGDLHRNDIPCLSSHLPN